MSNTSERPLGNKVDTTPAPLPSKEIKLVGKHITISGISSSHAPALFPLVGGYQNAWLWDYMPYDPNPTSESQLSAELTQKSESNDPVFYTLFKPDEHGVLQPVGWASYLRIDAKNRVIEVGHLMFSSLLQRSVAATEAMYLMAKYAFELGYRRYEWKCHDLNAPSKKAALRLGFVYEGTFRRHLIDKWGRNRDTAWFSIIEEEWEGRRKALEAWLEEGNFDESGRQKKRLEEFREV